jgi:glyoxylase-like metal-dependent hydrolase (beta-lactamase superfamily II)
MAVAAELVHLPPSLFLWQTYDPTAKADLFSSAIATANGIYLVDPIPLANAALAELQGSVTGIILTNANHCRAAAQFAATFSAPILARPESLPSEGRLNFEAVADGDRIGDELHVIEIDGAVAGEIALFHAPNGGALIVGDALINFEPYGFTFLPAKYCINQKEMRHSLRKLLAHTTERMLFAHGTPILSGAGERLKCLLDVDF